MDEKTIKLLEEKLTGVVDSVMEQKLKPLVGDIVAAETRAIVEKMKLDRALYGKDISGLNDKQKSDFVEVVKSVSKGMSIDTKANEALIEEQDNRGGYLVSEEIANAILRISASVGLVMSQAQQWPMGTDELGIPNYTGSFLEGAYLGVDAAGTPTGITFGQAKLIAKKWQLAFVLGNDLLADSSIALADWLLALGGEALANMIDKQAFIGSGAPFVGLLNNDDVTVMTLASGKDTFAEFNVIEDASAMIGSVEESVLDGAAFYMHRTVWASLRAQKDTAGHYILPQAGAVINNVLANNALGGGKKPAGEILGFPVYTCRHLPAIADTAVSTKYLVFGNFKCFAFGNKGDMRLEQFTSGSIGGKEIALADQKASILKHRHALTTALPAGFVVAKTAAS